MSKILFILASFVVISAEAIDMEKLKAELKKQAKKQGAAVPVELPPAPVCDASIRNGICYAFTGAAHADSKTAKGNEMACKLLRGKLVAASKCPDQRLLGRCKVAGGDPKEYVLHYYMTGKLNMSKAQQDCSNAKSGLHAQGAGVWM